MRLGGRVRTVASRAIAGQGWLVSACSGNAVLPLFVTFQAELRGLGRQQRTLFVPGMRRMTIQASPLLEWWMHVGGFELPDSCGVTTETGCRRIFGQQAGRDPVGG